MIAANNYRKLENTIIGKSHAMTIVKNKIIKFSKINETLFIEGETGTGKNLVARTIHQLSGKSEAIFLTVSMPNIPENLFESELFGYKKGAFTGAINDKKGIFEVCNKGTIYLDEITNLSLYLQSKLLRVIEEKKILKLGSSFEEALELRIIASSNTNLKKCIEEKKLREDLYYRLNVCNINIPPLRERDEDIELLIKNFKHYMKGRLLSNESKDFLEKNYQFPGNVRELINLMKKIGFESNDCKVNIQELYSFLKYREEGVLLCSKQYHNDQLCKDLKHGSDFWQLLWKQFLKRDINRSEMKEILNKFYRENYCSLKKMSKHLNIEDKDYAKFVAILHKYKIHPKEWN